MTHSTAPSFWQFYKTLPADVQKLADGNFKLLKTDPRHPSLHFKKIDKYWSVRVGIHYRALALESGDNMLWFWIVMIGMIRLLLGDNSAVLLN